MFCTAPDPGRTEWRCADGEPGEDVDPLLLAFRRAQRRRNLSTLTIASRMQRLRLFAAWLADRGVALSEATPQLVDEWLDVLDLTATTRNTYMSHLAAFFKFAVREGHMASSPLDRMDRPKRPDRLPRPIDEDDLYVALEEADTRMRAWLLLGALQGYRVSSMARLTVEGVDRRNMTLRSWAKGNRDHSMALHPEVLRALDAYGLPASGPVFRNQVHGFEHQPLAPATISAYIGRYFRELGTEWTAHQLRHLFCTLVVRNTGDIAVAADLAGHRSIATTKDYARVAAETSRAALATLRLAAG